MATDQVTADTEHIDMNIGGDETDWGKMDSKEQESSVADVVAKVRAKRDPELDAKIEQKTETTAEERKDETTVDDETSVDDDTAKTTDEDGTETEDEGEGKEGESDQSEWLDEDTRDLATAMGLSDEDLADFGSREELDRALRIVNRQAFEAGKVDGKQSKATVDDDQQRQEAYRQQKDQPKTQQKEGDSQTDDDPLADLAKFKLGDEFDEEAAKPLNDFVKAASEEIRNLRSEVAQMREAGEQEAEAGIRRQALESLHSLGHVELFGKADATLTAKQAANVEKAIEAHFIHANGLFAMGRRAAPTPAFLKVAVNMEFGDDITKQQQRRLTDKLRKQSARRTGGAATKSLPKPPAADETTRQRAQRLVADGLGERFKELADRS